MKLGKQAYILQNERDQLKKELYDLRKAVWNSRDNPAEDYDGVVDRLMGDWFPEKEDGDYDGVVDAERERMLDLLVALEELLSSTVELAEGDDCNVDAARDLLREHSRLEK